MMVGKMTMQINTMKIIMTKEWQMYMMKEMMIITFLVTLLTFTSMLQDLDSCVKYISVMNRMLVMPLGLVVHGMMSLLNAMVYGVMTFVN